jgi:hypothetical protein
LGGSPTADLELADFSFFSFSVTDMVSDHSNLTM